MPNESLNSGWESYSRLVLQQLESLSKGIDALRDELQDVKQQLAELKVKEDRVQELKAWKDKMDEVISPTQLKTALIELDDLIYVADVWLDEPTPSIPIIQKAFISTPHIAGYSIEGKSNGTSTVAIECARAFNCYEENNLSANSLIKWPHGLGNIVRDIHAYGFPISIFKSELNLRSISNILKNTPQHELAKEFNNSRANHPSRNDFNKYSFEGIIDLDELINLEFFNTIKNT